jgi:hypothetical protein
MVMLRLLLVAGCQNGPMSTRRRPPAGLDGPGRAFWRSVVAVYDRAPAEFTLLAQACAVVDLLALADAELKADGLTVGCQRAQRMSGVPSRPQAIRGGVS